MWCIWQVNGLVMSSCQTPFACCRNIEHTKVDFTSFHWVAWTQAPLSWCTAKLFWTNEDQGKPMLMMLYYSLHYLTFYLIYLFGNHLWVQWICLRREYPHSIHLLIIIATINIAIWGLAKQCRWFYIPLQYLFFNPHDSWFYGGPPGIQTLHRNIHPL